MDLGWIGRRGSWIGSTCRAATGKFNAHRKISSSSFLAWQALARCAAPPAPLTLLPQRLTLRYQWWRGAFAAGAMDPKKVGRKTSSCLACKAARKRCLHKKTDQPYSIPIFFYYFKVRHCTELGCTKDKSSLFDKRIRLFAFVRIS